MLVKISNPNEYQNWCETAIPGNSNASLGLVVKSGEFVSLGHYHSCFGDVQSRNLAYKVGTKSGIQEVHSRRMSLLEGAKEIEDLYYNWLIKDSPWASAFKKKTYGGEKTPIFVLDANLPASYVASAGVATRFLTETYAGYNQWPKRRYPLYKKLLKSGVDPLWAFIMCNLYVPTANNKFVFTTQNGHHYLPPNLTVGELRNFVNGTYLKEPTFMKEGGYEGIDRTWGGASGKLISALAKTWSFKSSTQVDHNLFRRPDLTNGFPAITFEEVMLAMDILKGLLNDK